ncbi:hypothetical protein [Iodobacter sp.]|uniref:hypothetical protein n=1 Tax=Iodobacter sp. TaxID=1915058 RepID=UPI0025F50F77|nr:hypothetical protein [Iodobacter sp.]
MRKRPAEITNPQEISVSEYGCIDAGGFYLTFSRPNVKITMNGRDNPAITAVTYAINGGDIGLPERILETKHAEKILCE